MAEEEIQQGEGNMLEYNIKGRDITEAFTGRKLKLFMKMDGSDGNIEYFIKKSENFQTGKTFIKPSSSLRRTLTQKR